MHLAESNLGVRSRSRNSRVAIRRLFSINLIAYFEFRISPKLEREREREKERGGREGEREGEREGGRQREKRREHRCTFLAHIFDKMFRDNI
jgi:hypothetical protein